MKRPVRFLLVLLAMLTVLSVSQASMIGGCTDEGTASGHFPCS